MSLVEEGAILCCDECGSSALVKDGSGLLSNGERKQKYRCKSCGESVSNPVYLDTESTEVMVGLAKKTQKLQDTQRVERKAFREHARVDNMVSALNENLIRLLEENKFHDLPTFTPVDDNATVGLIQLADLHFNELINIPSNQYDFSIASKRLHKYAERAVDRFIKEGVQNVVIVSTGDLLNSDRRLDEITAAATNRTQAAFLGVDILQQFIAYFAEHFKVTVSWVCGNEGRVHPELGWNDIVASDNYDHMIMLMLQKLFSGSPVEFHAPSNPSEQIVDINGFKLLIVHGHGGALGKSGDVGKTTQGIRSKYAEQGIIIDYVVWGHIHEALIADLFARSGSPAGANAYSHNALSLNGRASQNYYLIRPDERSCEGTRVDLQNYERYEGFDIDEGLAAYNVKSALKLVSHETILQIQI